MSRQKRRIEPRETENIAGRNRVYEPTETEYRADRNGL